MLIVRAAGRLLVLGVSEAGVQTVHDRPDQDADPSAFPSILAEASAEEKR